MYQQIVLVGNAGGEAELRYTQTGIAVCSFSLAVNRSWSKDGEKQDKTTWFRVTFWRKVAEIAAQFVTKGKLVMVIGEVEEARTWTDQEGNTRASLDVTGYTLKLLGTKGEESRPISHMVDETSEIPF